MEDSAVYVASAAAAVAVIGGLWLMTDVPPAHKLNAEGRALTACQKQFDYNTESQKLLACTLTIMRQQKDEDFDRRIERAARDAQ